MLIWLLVNIRGTYLAETFDIPKMSVRIDCTAPKLMPTSLAMLRSSHLLSHITRGAWPWHFHQLWHLWSSQTVHHPQRSLSPLKLCCPFFHCALGRIFLSRGFHEVFLNFLGKHSFLTEVLDNRPNFKFLHFANVSHPAIFKVLYISNQAWQHAFLHSRRASIGSNNQLKEILIQWI